MEPAEQSKAAQLAEQVAAARSVLFITGAGLSADSGMPTYRGVGGLYNGRSTPSGVPIEVALSGGMLRRDPDLCWRHIREIGEACRGRRPNRGHEVMARLDGVLERVLVLTQNVDGLHRVAGQRSLIEIHGDLRQVTCMAGCGTALESQALGAGPGAPRCPRCGGVLRPDVVLFGEALPPAAVDRLVAELERGFELVVAVGTTAVFPYIAGPVFDQAERGLPTAEINPGDSEVSGVVGLHVRAGAAEVLDVVGRRLGV